MPDPSYKALSYKVIPVDDADQIELRIEGDNGLTWSFGIPFSRSTGRVNFDEVGVIEMDFGQEFADMVVEEIEELAENLIADGE